MSDTLDLVCPSCGRTLRIAAEHAGKQVRCPACQQISAAPAAVGVLPATAQTILPAAAAEDAAPWHLRTPEGAVYGPISWPELLSWVTEGRVAADCELSSAPDGPWQRADAVLPVLRAPAAGEQTAPASSGASASAPIPGSVPPSPYPAPSYRTAAYPVMPALPPGVAPHRGALVLIFGLVGIVMGCPLFSALAWIMGSRDLREIRAGRMDRSGEGVTVIGMVLGMIITILWLVASLIFLTIALVAIATKL